MAYNRADFTSALSVWKPLAERGDPQAQTYVGEIYENGLGTEESYVEAAHWFKLASDQDYARAKINLGYLYESGRGVQKNIETAVNLYREASGFTDGKLEYVSSHEQAHRDSEQVQTKLDKLKTRQLEKQIADYQLKIEKQTETLKLKSQKISSLKSKINAKKQLPTSLPKAATTQSSTSSLTSGTYHRKETQSLELPKPDFPTDTSYQENENSHSSQQMSQSRTADTAEQIVYPAENNQQELEKLESELLVENRKFARVENTLQIIQLELSDIQKTVKEKDLQVADMEVHSTPRIEIIDPPMSINNGQSLLTMRTGVSTQLIGKVSPTSSLFALHINGSNHSYNKGGLFKFTLDDSTPKDVNLVAVNQEGESSRLSLQINRTTENAHPGSENPGSASESTALASLPPIDFGDYHALLIGNDDYQHYEKLETSGNDVDAIGKLLSIKYGFNIQLLKNATQLQIIQAFDQLISTLEDTDNLLIYYAGRCVLDKSDKGFWLPVDADRDLPSTWINNKAITDLVNSMEAKHVILISDSCFTGTLTRTSIARPLAEISDSRKLKWMEAVSQSRVRTVLSSGQARPVSNRSDHTEHSIFADALIGALTQNQRVLEAYGLYVNVHNTISENNKNAHNDQSPFYAPIKHAGHEAGEFLFVPATN